MLRTAAAATAAAIRIGTGAGATLRLLAYRVLPPVAVAQLQIHLLCAYVTKHTTDNCLHLRLYVYAAYLDIW